MKSLVLLSVLAASTQAFAISEKMTCFDVQSNAAYEVTYSAQNLTATLKDLVTKKEAKATTDIFSFSGTLPLFMSTEQLDGDGRAMLAEGCNLNPSPKGNVVNVMLWSGKVNGLSPIADLCLTCG